MAEKNILGTEKIGKLLLTFSIPCIISMLINSIYNIVDQIFIGQGVGTIGNAATNVIFPIVIICNAVAGLIGNGCAANLSLKLGEGKEKEAKKSVGGSITLIVISSILIACLGELFLGILVNFFGCTNSVYESAMTYGRIILIGAPFMIIYTGLSSIIRADGSPKYSMICLVIGAIINLILDPVFIFKFNMGVAGGALATILGQMVSLIIAVAYIPKMKSFKLKLDDYKLDSSIFKTLSLGLSSFITQMTILVLFIVMNNLMTKYGASTKFGSDIPLSVYGVISKLNSLYVSSILGIAIGAQPIIGFNYGAGNYNRVKETLKKVLIIGFVIGIIFNLMFMFFPSQIASIFITKSDLNYNLFMEFAVSFCRIFLGICFLNAFEMISSIVIQSLGNVKKATFVSFARQILLFVPIACILTHFIGLYGALYAGLIADSICFIIVIFIFTSEYKKIKKLVNNKSIVDINKDYKKIESNKHIVITIAREYGSGGRYVGRLLADALKIKFYDKELIKLVAEQSGLSINYVETNEEKRSDVFSSNSIYNNDDNIFISESKVIKDIAKESCVIIGRCANYILKDEDNVFRMFLYSSEANKINRVVKYYGIEKKNALKTINKIDKERSKHYKYYTGLEWKDFDNYDLTINVDSLGVEKTASIIKEIILNK